MSTTETHTAGPWKYHSECGCIVAKVQYGQEWTIATMVNTPPPKGFGARAANCALIAECPELLRALQLLVTEMEENHYGPNYDGDSDEPIMIAKASISRATGGQP